MIKTGNQQESNMAAGNNNPMPQLGDKVVAHSKPSTLIEHKKEVNTRGRSSPTPH